MFKVLKIEDKQEWKDLVTQCNEYDFYHTWDYHMLSKDNGEGEPELFTLVQDESIIALPLLKREIKDKSGAVIGFDYTSAYGYVGPIFKGKITDPLLELFKQKFKQYCLDNNIVSVFSRLHPTIEQNELLNQIGNVENTSVTIQIDLTQTLVEQKRHYRKSNKSEINKLRKICTVEWSDNTEEDLNAFIDIYEETMLRVNAHDRYFFDKKYYENLFNATDYKTQLVFAKLDGVRIAAVLFVFCKNIIQYHLAGTRVEHMKLTPMKLLLDELRLYGTEKGYKTMHLGGGLSSSEEDPLYRFKKGFSKIHCQFNTFKYIIDVDRYDQLSEALISDSEKLKSNYFPLYRA